MGGRGASSIARKFGASMTGNSGGNAFPIDVSTIQNQSLQAIENRIRRLQHEEAFVFDKDGNLVAGVSGGNSSVNIPDQWKTMDDATVTHGHPTGIYNFGGTLSTADATMMASTNWSELRASANGQGEYNYIMRRTPRSDNAGLMAQIQKDTPRLENQIVSEFKSAYNGAIAQGKSRELALHEGAQRGTGIMQTYWRQTLPQYGFEFVTPKKEYDYGR